ncbi:MAG: FHA domain-containing protein [Planctomycetota bacterium]|jgi:pSer/pThr/pTyr-binding forkhead associated (FHA) protein
MNVHLTLDQFIQTFASLTQEKFLVQFPHPLLLIDLGSDLEVPTEALKAKTAVPDGQLTAFEVSDLLEQSGIYIASVKKTKRNNFQGGVTLGRAPHNDVVLPHQAISKFHAFFQTNAATGAWEIQDVDSKYGTTLDEKPLPPGEARPTRNGSTIVVAKYVKVTFFHPKEFYTHLHLLLHKRKKEEGK